MSVYVDNMEAPFRGMIMCHMIADTHAELVAMADQIGVSRRWIQYPGTWHEHFDISKGKRTEAVKAGAIEITWRQCAAMAFRLRETGKMGKPEEAEAWHKERTAALLAEKEE